MKLKDENGTENITGKENNKNSVINDGADEEFAVIFKRQAAADLSAGIEGVKNIEYCKIASSRRPVPFVSFYYYLCAFLLVFIVFMAYNISRIADERLADETPRASYEFSYESDDLKEKSVPAFYDKYRDPLAVLFFFAVEGVVLFFILAVVAVFFRFAYIRFSSAGKKPGVLLLL